MRGGLLLLPVAIVAWLTAFVAWTGNDPRLNDRFAAFSTYSTSPGGLSQAYAYLDARPGSDAHRLMRSLTLENPPHQATIFRIGATDRAVAEPPPAASNRADKSTKQADAPDESRPVTPATMLLSTDEEAWVRRGGRIIIGTIGRHAGLDTHHDECSPRTSVFPVIPPVPAFASPHCRSLTGEGLRRFHSLVIDDHGPVIARRIIGEGEVLAFSMPEAISNQQLGETGNLELLEWMAGSGRPVYFDETIHGFERKSSVVDLLVDDWRLGPALLLLALAGLASFWRRAKTAGPPDWPERETRSDAVELVQSLGQLYDRSVDREESLRLYYQGFIRVLHARTGLTGEALERVASERTRGYDPGPRFKDISRDEFQHLLAILNRAYETVGYANTR